MYPFVPEYLPTSDAFELLVFLTLRAENPTARSLRRRAPDLGVDILVDFADTRRWAVQCKHYKQGSNSKLVTSIRDSLSQAVKHKDTLRWTAFHVFVSRELTARQWEQLEAMSRDFDLDTQEFQVRPPSAYVETLYRNPDIWKIAAGNPLLTPRQRNLSSPIAPPFFDDRLQHILSEAKRKGVETVFPQFLYDSGFRHFDSVIDWYSVAEKYFEAVHQQLRVMTFDQEIPTFWITDLGAAYLRMNERLLARNVKIKRLYVLDFSKASSNAPAFRSFVMFAAENEHLGADIRIIPLDVFAESSWIECQIFNVVDHDSVVIFNSECSSVNVMRESDIVQDAIDLFDELFAHKESRTPNSLLSR